MISTVRLQIRWQMIYFVLAAFCAVTAPMAAQSAPAESQTTDPQMLDTLRQLQAQCSGSGNAAPECALLPKEMKDRGSVPTIRSGQPIKFDEEDLRPSIVPDTTPDAPTEFQKLVSGSIGKLLPIYGQGLFKAAPSTFAAADKFGVPGDYVLGPGDGIVIRAWGQVDIDIRTSVDRTGSIYIPKVGSLMVAGIRFDQLSGYIKNAISRVYHNFELSVTIGSLRSIRVFVVGQARKPGSYTVSSLSTLVNAIFATAGPSPNGSMRHIQLKRQNQLVTDFDLYDLLIKGDKSKDVRLEDGDVIYYPATGPMVAFSGSVNVPGIYELAGNETLGSALTLAGGMSVTAAGQIATIERIENHAVRHVEEFSLNSADLERKVQDGDLVTLIPVSPQFDNAVTLRGNTANPGRYPWHEGMRISDLIPNREYLITRDYWANQNGTVQPITIRGVCNNDINEKNGKGDKDARTDSPDCKDKKQLSDDDTRQDHVNVDVVVQNEIRRNGPEINWEYALVQRLNRTTLAMELLPFNLGKALSDRDDANNLRLKAGDIVTVFSQSDLQVPVAQRSKFVRLEGEFSHAGVYQVQPGDTLRTIVARAGGLVEGAYLFGAEFTRVSSQQEQQKRLNNFLDDMQTNIERSATTLRAIQRPEDAAFVAQRTDSQRRILQRLRETKASGRIVLDFNPNAKSDSIPELSLEDGDRFYVPPRPAVVTVIGAVYNSNSYLYDAKLRALDYLKLAGGGTREADRSRAFLVRADGSVLASKQAESWWRGGINSVRIMPGDTLVVPEKFETYGFTRGFKDWSQILSQLALGAAGLNVILK